MNLGNPPESSHREPIWPLAGEEYGPEPGWPECVLPVSEPVFMPPQLVDDETDNEVCQCDQVTNVISPFGPFSSIKSRCRQCFKPVHAGQQNCPKVIKWEIFVRNLIQRWEYRYWSSLPAVRQQYFWTWFELFATYKYNTPDLLLQVAPLVRG